jgi:hypothetical protein
MTTFEVVDARLFHCGPMIRALRNDHKVAFMALGVHKAHHELRACFDDSHFRRSWLINGRVAGIGGVRGTLCSPVGYIWLALSQDATHYPIQIMREARAQIAEIMEVKRSLGTTILKADSASVRFAERLGFREIDRIEDWGVVMVLGETP